MTWIEGDTVGKVLKSIRADWGRHTPGYLSQLKMANLLRDKHGKYAPSQGFISNIENDSSTIFDLQPDVRLSMLELYPIGREQVQEMNERFGLNLPGFTPPPSDLPEPQDVGGFVRLEVIRAQGGTLDLDDDEKERRRGPRFVNVPEVFLNGSRPKDTKIVEVLGSSMCCEDIRLTIPEGSFVLVNTVDEPQTGDIIVCDLQMEGRWIRILKIFDRVGHIVLRSYNDDHAPIILQGDMELIKIGVYVNHTGPGRLAMRRLNRARGLAK